MPRSNRPTHFAILQHYSLIDIRYDYESDWLVDVGRRERVIAKPTNDDWQQFSTFLDRIFAWGLEQYPVAAFDVWETWLDLEFDGRLIQKCHSSIVKCKRWRLLIAACSMLSGKQTSIELDFDFPRQHRPSSSRNTQEYYDYVDSPKPPTATTLSELIELWDKCVSPSDSHPLSVEDWTVAAQHWESINKLETAAICNEIAKAIATYVPPLNRNPHGRPWWSPEGNNQGPPCPICKANLRTASAQQCFRCGADWH